MRISQSERNAIVDSAHIHFGADCSVTLFGSRADDDRRGGDTDLLVTTSLDADTAFKRRIDFLVDLKKRIGDRRIDVVIRAWDSEPKTVYEIAEKEGVLLS